MYQTELAESDPTGTSVLDFKSPEPGEANFCCFKHPVSCTSLWQPELRHHLRPHFCSGERVCPRGPSLGLQLLACCKQSWQRGGWADKVWQDPRATGSQAQSPSLDPAPSRVGLSPPTWDHG